MTSTSQPNVKQVKQRKGSKGGSKIKRDLYLVQSIREEGIRQNIVSMSCDHKTARCVRFSCFLSDLRANTTAVIKLRSRLWNSTLIEDYAHGVTLVQISSHAFIKLDSALDIRQTRIDNDATVAITNAYPDTLSLPPPEAPLWAYIIAIIVGIILLVVLILILWKLGFFERKKYGQLPGSEETTNDKQFESQAFN